MKKILIAGMINLLLLNIVLAQDVWQYKVYQFSDSIPLDVLFILGSIPNVNEETSERLEYRLNSFGLEGWELIKVFISRIKTYSDSYQGTHWRSPF